MNFPHNLIVQTTTFPREDDMLLYAARLPIGAMTFVVESETLYVRVQKGFRPATVIVYML